MLQKAMKLDQVHIFRDPSRSELVERIDSIIERALFIEMNRKQRSKPNLLVTIFSLGYYGLFNETEKTSHKSKVHGYAIDNTRLYENFT